MDDDIRELAKLQPEEGFIGHPPPICSQCGEAPCETPLACRSDAARDGAMTEEEMQEYRLDQADDSQ